MADSTAIADRLLSSDAGVIACVNILDGVDVGLYDEAFAATVFWWWGEYVVQTGSFGLDIASALGKLIDLANGRGPDGFLPPAIPLAGVHIHCRREDDRFATEERGSVRDAASLGYWAHPEDRRDLKDDGVNLRARDGTEAYKETMAALRKRGNVRSVRLDLHSNATLTNKERGSDAILFFTLARDLIALIAACGERARADRARDSLGLVHVEPRVQHILVVFPSGNAEDRADRGRPTVLDSGGNTRFLSLPSGYDGADAWGRTADLEQIPAGWPDVGRLPERVCGPYPDYAGKAPVPAAVDVHFLGAASVPRDDGIGKHDDIYAGLLHDRRLATHGKPLRKVIEDLLQGYPA